MNTTTKNLSAAEQAVLDEARKVNEERMKTVEQLASIVAEKIELEEQQKDHARRERKAIKAAETAGWTPAQIKRFMKPPQPKKTTPKPAQHETKASDNAPNNTNPSVPQER